MSCFLVCLLSVGHSCLINILPWNEFLFEEGSAADVFEDLSYKEVLSKFLSLGADQNQASILPYSQQLRASFL